MIPSRIANIPSLSNNEFECHPPVRVLRVECYDMAVVKKEACVGSRPGHLPLRNTFDWCFAQPFSSENDFTPASHKLPRIEDSRPIFVDNQSGA